MGGLRAAARKALGSLAQAARAAHLKLEVVRDLEQVLASDTHARRGVRHGVRGHTTCFEIVVHQRVWQLLGEHGHAEAGFTDALARALWLIKRRVTS